MKTFLKIIILIAPFLVANQVSGQNVPENNKSKVNATDSSDYHKHNSRNNQKEIVEYRYNIYYDAGKANLNDEAKILLDNLCKTMLDYPYLVLEISSDTDCRGSTAYNDSLSQQRAKIAVDYMVTKGIDRNRLVPIGYGSHQLVNNCDCKSDDSGKMKNCTKAEHRQNRRTTWKILRTDYDSEKERKYSKGGSKVPSRRA